jgi:hypothetical protein
MWSASRPACFIPGGTASHTSWLRGLVNLRTGQDSGTEVISMESNLTHPTVLRYVDCSSCERHCGSQCDILGRAIAQAVSRWLPTTAARVQTWVWNFVIDKSGAGAGFLRELRFPLPI